MSNYKYNGDELLTRAYSVNNNKPVDVRTVFDSKTKMLSPLSWGIYDDIESQWELVLYQGMIVAVVGDTDSTNDGVYILKELPDLTDPNLTSLSGWEKMLELPNTSSMSLKAGDVVELEYSDGNFSWRKKSASNLGDLEDVDLSTTPTSGQVLQYNGTSWVAATPSGGGDGGTGTTSEPIDYSSLFLPTSQGGLGYTNGEFGWLTSSSYSNSTIPQGTSYDDIFKKIFTGVNINITASNLSNVFDGQPHAITPTASMPSSGYTVQYATCDSSGNVTGTWSTWSSSLTQRTMVGTDYYKFRIVSNDDTSTALASTSKVKNTITVATVTVTSQGSNKVYDGTALTNSNVSANTLSSYIQNLTATGSQTNVGSSLNTMTYTIQDGYSDCITVNENKGQLTVYPLVQYSIDNGSTWTTLSRDAGLVIDNVNRKVSGASNVYYVNGSSAITASNVFYIRLYGVPEQEIYSKWYWDDSSKSWVATTSSNSGNWGNITIQSSTGKSDGYTYYKFSNKNASNVEIQYEYIPIAFTTTSKN